MMKTFLRLGVVSAFLLIASSASAAKTTFAADLLGANEVTPVVEIDPNTAVGGAVFTYDDATKTLCGRIEYDGLTGAPTGIHVHQAPKGMPNADGAADAKVIIPIAASPVTFKVILPDAWATSLMAGEIYTNVHTEKNPKGEGRGTMDPFLEGTEVPCPAGNPLTIGGGGGGDAGTTSDAGSTSSSSSSTSGGADNTSSSSSSSSGGNSSSGGLASEEAPPADKGGCNTTSSAPANLLSVGLILGVVGAAIVRMRKRRS